MKKVLFVNGPSQDPGDRFGGWPTPLLYAIAPTVEAIRKGSLSLAFCDKIFEPWYYVEGENSEQIKNELRQILEEGVDIICASAIYDSLYPVLQMFALAKTINPHVTTVLGGPYFDEVHGLRQDHEILGDTPLVDYAIAGDGEIVLRELLRELAKQGVPDLNIVVARSAGRAWIYNNRGVGLAINKPLLLDELPFMPTELASKRHRSDFGIFRDDDGATLPTIQIITARGCPSLCTFCSERSSLAQPNARSIENIVREVYLRKDQGFKAVFFDDSTFGAYPELPFLLRELGKTGMKFGSLNRFDNLTDPNLVEMYVEAGFTYLYCSVEQLLDSTLKGIGKGQTTSQIIDGMRQLSVHEISVGLSLLYGTRSETSQSIKATHAFAQEWVEKGVVEIVSLSALCLHPGTPDGAGLDFNYNRTPLHSGYPWNAFEEGGWDHPQHITAEYLEVIAREANEKFSRALVRNRHS